MARKEWALSAGQFKEAKKLIRHLYASGAARFSDVLIQNRSPIPDPLPDIIEYLRSFDRDRGANGHDMRPGNPPDPGANGQVTQQNEGDPNEIS